MHCCHLVMNNDGFASCKLIVWITSIAHAAVTRFTSQICYEKSNSECSNRCLGLDCGQSCKKKAHQPFLSCDLSSWKRVFKSAWGKRGKRPHYHDSQLHFLMSHQNLPCLSSVMEGCKRHLGGGGLLHMVRQQLYLNTCLPHKGMQNMGCFFAYLNSS